MVGELTRMRRARARTTIDYLQAPTLLWHLGRGDVEVAAKFFEALAKTDDEKIRAALASLGFGNWEMNIEDRMAALALYYDLENTRTVRRWADEGFRRIAVLIMEWSLEVGNDRSTIKIAIVPDGIKHSIIEATGYPSPGAKWFEPTIEYKYESTNWDNFSVYTSDEQREGEAFKGTLRVQLPEAGNAVEIVVTWLGNEPPYYQVSVSPLAEIRCDSVVTKRGCILTLENVSRKINGERKDE